VLPDGVPRHRARGPAYTIGNSWRQAVLAEIHERGWNPTKLAEEAGIALSSLSEALEMGPDATTRLAPHIHRALGWPKPKPLTASDVDPVMVEIRQGLEQIDREGMDAVREVIRRMKKKTEKS
jgi:lambda repressor-like predicted transcriptional regulator